MPLRFHSCASLDDRLLAELPRVRTLLRRLCGAGREVDDLVQQVFLRALRYKASYDEAGSLHGWLARIAFRVFVDDRARQRRAPQPLGDGVDAIADPPAGNTQGRVEQQEELERLLRRLSLVERDVLLAFHRDRRSIREIAAAMALPEGTVKSHLHRARRKLAGSEPGAER